MTTEQLSSLRRQHNITTIDRARRLLFRRAMLASGGNQHLAARLLGVNHKTIWRWVQESRA